MVEIADAGASNKQFTNNSTVSALNSYQQHNHKMFMLMNNNHNI